MQPACPSQEQLRAFAVGDVSRAGIVELVRHLDACTACRDFLASLDGCTDELVRNLRALDTQSTTTDVAAPDEGSTGGERGHSRVTTSDLALDLGRRYARKLADGPCRLGRFELQAELGEGTFGYVFRAKDLELDRNVAVKIQRAGVLASDDEVSRFLREARSAAQLHHPNIVSLYDSGRTEDDVCYLVSEYVDGVTLEARIGADRFQPREAAELVAELAETLQYAHDHGVIHRDVKPSNIILDAGGRPHITDFGLAKRMSVDQTLTSEGQIVGTPAYMPPEQARGDTHGVDARSDVYSLGVILYELLTGERPFQGNRRIVMLQVLEEEPRAPRQLDDQIPKDLQTICAKAMAKSPARRYPSAQDLADDLRRYLEGGPIHARPTGYAERLWRWCRRYPLAASLLVAVSLGSAVGFWHLSRLSTYFVEETALDSARMEAEMLERINAYYSEKVVDQLDQEKVKVTHDYSGRNDAIPLPATLLIDAGEHISRGNSGMQVQLYSDYPWRSRPAKDAFQVKALAALQAKVKDGAMDMSLHEFTDMDGRRVLRYARAQIMKQSCVKCHNEDPSSPKRDWSEGDLAGALEITRPLDRDVERTRAGLSGAFALMVSVGSLLVGLSLAIVLATRLRHKATISTTPANTT